MARITYETMKVVWLPTAPASESAPTVANITAGTNLTAEIPVNGIEKGGSANNASQAMLGDAYVAEEPGTWSRTLTITFMRDVAATLAWDLFDYKTSGWFVFSPTGLLTAGTKVEVWKVTSHERQGLASAENEYQKFSVNFAVVKAPVLDATIAA
jgi:hypothetical protein